MAGYKISCHLMQTKLKILAESGIYTFPYVKKSEVLIFVEKLMVVDFFIHQKLSWNFRLWTEEFKGWWFQSLLYTTDFSSRFWNSKREAYGTCYFSVWSYCVSGLSRSAVITGPKQNIQTQKITSSSIIFFLVFCTG